MKKSAREGLRTWIEIDRKSLKHNFGVFRSLIPKKTSLMAVVKSNAYGHGLVDFSREMERLHANFLGVDSVTEALALRREGIRLPILVLGYTLPEMILPAAAKDISLSVSSLESLRHILADAPMSSKPLKIHIKVDTGMHRQGFLAGDLPKILGELKVKSMPHSIRRGGLFLGKKFPPEADPPLAEKVVVEGLFTHFASAKNPSFRKDTENQIAEFKKWSSAFKDAGLHPLVHAAASGGTMLFPESYFDMVRIGIGLYGLWPDREVKEYLKDAIRLRPALIWKSVITEVKKFPKGERIGYGLTETFPEEKTVAIVPVGYWHGYPRALSSIGRMIVGGKLCKVLGIVSMDMISIDVSRVKNCRVGDEVVVIGNDSSSPCSMEGISGIPGFSWYETTTRLNPLIKRIYR